LSTAEKLGAELLLDDAPPDECCVLDEPPLAALPEEEGLLDEPELELPDIDGEDEDDEAAGLLLDFDDEESFATASVDSAKSTAAVVMLRVLGM